MKILEKLQKRLQEGKKDNKGFSLVELIIVIAIMAILVGIVGMTVIPQIENSRKATDEQVLSALVTEAMEAYTQAVYAVGKYTITIHVDKDSGELEAATISPAKAKDGDGSDKLLTLFNALGSKRSLKSNAGKAIGDITITMDGSVSGSDASPIVLKANGFNDITVR